MKPVKLLRCTLSNVSVKSTANANSQFVFRISTAVAGADTDGTARFVLSF